MKTKMKVCQVRHLLGPVPQKNKRTIAFQLLSLCFLLVPVIYKLMTKFLRHNFIAFIIMIINPNTSVLKVIETNCCSCFVVSTVFTIGLNCIEITFFIKFFGFNYCISQNAYLVKLVNVVENEIKRIRKVNMNYNQE